MKNTHISDYFPQDLDNSLKENPQFIKYADDLWDGFEEYADSNFKKEFQESKQKMHERFWEMYLGCFLIQNGLKLEKPPKPSKTTKSRRDFLIRDINKTIWIEAVSFNDACTDNLKMETPQDCTFNAKNFINNASLRYTSSFQAKMEQLTNDLNPKSDIISKQDSIVIAINSCNIPWSLTPLFDNPSDGFDPFWRSMLGVGPRIVAINDNTENPRVIGNKLEANLKKIDTHNSIESALLLREENTIVSGVIDCRLCIYERSKIRFIHNPLAKNKLDEGWIKNKEFEEWIFTEGLLSKIS